MNGAGAVSTIEPGHYAKKQILCRSGIIGWSHQSRFRLATKLVEPYAGGTLLDYGCGDATFLGEVRDTFRAAVGADIDPKQNQDCRRRFAGIPNVSFVLTSELTQPEHEAAYDVVTCMEVLEHCIDEDANRTLSDLRRLVAPRGIVIISVPVEIGPALIGKQVLRRLAGWRQLGDYKHGERYSARELCRMLFAGERTAIERPVHRASPESVQFHTHKGFNWRSLRTRLRQTFEVKQTLFSPLPYLGGYFSSQAWFVCTLR